jgi:hypothetical protein
VRTSNAQTSPLLLRKEDPVSVIIVEASVDSILRGEFLANPGHSTGRQRYADASAQPSPAPMDKLSVGYEPVSPEI